MEGGSLGILHVKEGYVLALLGGQPGFQGHPDSI